MLSPEFWQRLLATEAPPERLWPVVKAARAAAIDPDNVDSWVGTTSADAVKAAGAGKPAPRAVIVEWNDFPAAAQTQEAPVAVFASGDTSALDRPLVGIVGTRRASSYGRSMATHFSAELARSGCTVVSGGAIGIDSFAHEGAMDAGGRTVCVLPCGVDVAYPARHRDLFARIAGQGCLVSPFACGTPEQDHRLLARNRLVALLCQALVIIEAPAGSGSLGTAQYASELGRAVLVVPGPANQDTFKGSHALIRSGATLVDEPAQVLAEMGLEASARPDNGRARLSGDELSVFESLQGVPRSPESISDETGLAAQSVLTALTMLEIEGIAIRTPEGYALRP